MPIVRIDMLEGRDHAHKTDLMRRVTDAVVAALQVRPEQVRVLLCEFPPDHWSIGGSTMTERAASVAPQEQAR